jgi:hypothetical protein
MARRILKDPERAVAERLSREDMQSRPEFSEALHDRICHAIRCDADGSIDTRPAPAGRKVNFRRVAWAVAAVCLAGIAVWIWKTEHAPPAPVQNRNKDIVKPFPVEPQPNKAWSDAPVVDLAAVTDLPKQMSAKLPALVDASIHSRRWAYLDHDARLTMEMLAQRMPLDLLSATERSKPEAMP